MANIKHLLKIDAPREKVYEAITSVKGLEGWWTPEVDQPDDKTLVFHFGPEYAKKFEVVNSTSGQEVEWKCTEAHPEWVGTDIRFELAEEDGQTVLVFNHNNWEDYTEMFAICNFNWALFLRSLKKLVEEGKGIPHPDQID